MPSNRGETASCCAARATNSDLTARYRFARRLLLCLFCLIALSTGVAAPALTLDDGTELSLQRFPATGGERLLIWLPSEHGLPESTRAIAARLAGRGTEVWLADLLESYFLPAQASSLAQIPDTAVARLVEHALEHSERQVFLVAEGRGAIPLLRGLRAWQLRHGFHPRLRGALLISPNLYIETPEAGELARYHPIARATNLPLYVLQAEKSPWRWRLDALQSRLAQGSGGAWLEKLPGVRDRFYFRPDASPTERAMAAELPRYLERAMNLLAATPLPRGAAPLPEDTPPPGRARQAARLAPVTPRPAPALALARLEDGRAGAPLDLAALRGEVVLVNFWASWCPPCVHEMPSMQRLATHLRGRPFRIVAVNMAEDPATIRQFLATRVSVDFPVVLDRDGAALRRWRVFAFPTSYLVDKQGQIRFAVFGAVDWDTPEVHRAVDTLLAE